SNLKSVGVTKSTRVTGSAKGPLRQSLSIVLVPLGLKARIEDEALVVGVRNPKTVEEVHQDVKAAALTAVKIKAQNRPLSDALGYLQEQVKVPIVIESHKLRAAKISTTQTVSVDLTDVPLKDALQQMLQPLQLKAEARGDVIAITTVN